MERNSHKNSICMEGEEDTKLKLCIYKKEDTEVRNDNREKSWSWSLVVVEEIDMGKENENAELYVQNGQPLKNDGAIDIESPGTAHQISTGFLFFLLYCLAFT